MRALALAPHLVALALLGGCASTPSAAAAHLKGTQGSHRCEEVRRPNSSANEGALQFRDPGEVGGEARWEAAIRATSWWREQQLRTPNLALALPAAIRVAVTPRMRGGPGPGGLVVRATWTGASGGAPPKTTAGGDALLYFDGDLHNNGAVDIGASVVLLAQTDEQPWRLQTDNVGLMRGDDQRWVLFGLVRHQAERATRGEPDGFGWLGWFDDQTLHTADHTCVYHVPE